MVDKRKNSGDPAILIADDQADVAKALRLLLKSQGYQVETAASPEEVLHTVTTRDFDVVLMDLNYTRGQTTGRQGLDLLAGIQRVDSDLPVVVMTAWASVELAVEAMRKGARDFVEKPWRNERLLGILRTQVELGRALRRGRQLEQENVLLRGEDPIRMIADSRVMQPVLETIARVGPSDANVLITGENGSGKGMVARALHAASGRSERPMIQVNTASIPETVFESELFGHVAGAFTDAKSNRMGRFQLADGGTLFLDEIATIPTGLQSKLLRVLESGEFEPIGSSKTCRIDARVLSATNADIGQEISGGRFRQDLLYRLNTVHVHVPPLRERPEDIPALAEMFLRRHAGKYRRDITGLAPSALQALIDHTWPGNVRQLDHAIERAVLMARDTLLRVEDLGLAQPGGEQIALERMTLDGLERWAIRKALDRTDGDISKAADALGLSRAALYRRLEKHQIT